MKKATKAMMTLLTAALLLAWAVPAIAEDMGKININTADREELMLLEGIGESYAERIIEYRQANGPFQQPEDIMKVKGIGPKIFELNKDRIQVQVE